MCRKLYSIDFLKFLILFEIEKASWKVNWYRGTKDIGQVSDPPRIQVANRGL